MSHLKQYRITDYELAAILGKRAVHLSKRAPPMVDVGDMVDPLDIARKEYEQGVLPMILTRDMPNGTKVEIRLSKDRNN